MAIITVSGVIVDGDGYVKKQIERVRQDEDVKAIVLRVNTPGGTVTGSDYILHHLNRLRAERKLPLVVSMGSVAASGGYYVSMAVGDQPQSIYAEPTTTTGSIGVHDSPLRFERTAGTDQRQGRYAGHPSPKGDAEHDQADVGRPAGVVVRLSH